MIMNNPDLGDYVKKIMDAHKGQQIFFGFILVGLIVKVGLSFAGAATALLWGYFIIIFSIIGLVFLRVDTTKDNMTALKPLFDPLLLVIIVLLWNISLNLRFYDEINEKHFDICQLFLKLGRSFKGSDT